jgi:hypothetical protein
MRIHLFHDQAGNVVGGGVAAPGVNVALAPKSSKRLQTSTLERADLEYPDHHARLQEIAAGFTVHPRPRGLVLKRIAKQKSRSRKRPG